MPSQISPLSLALVLVAFFGFYLPPLTESHPLPARQHPTTRTTTPSPSKPQTHIHLVEENDDARKAYFLRQKEHQLQWSGNTGGRINLDSEQSDLRRLRRFVIGSSDVRLPSPEIMIKHMGRRSVSEAELSEAGQAQDSREAKDEDFKRRLALAFMLSGGEEHRKPSLGASYGGR